MTSAEIIRQAKLIGKNPKEELLKHAELALEEAEAFIQGVTPPNEEIAKQKAIVFVFAAGEIDKATNLLKLAQRIGDRKEDNWDERIELARQYPIEALVEFKREWALAFCHADRNPSLKLYKASNTCHCFACNKSFNPIDVLMERDGMSFKEAVEWLTN